MLSHLPAAEIHGALAEPACAFLLETLIFVVVVVVVALFFVYLFFKTGSHHLALAVLELTL